MRSSSSLGTTFTGWALTTLAAAALTACGGTDSPTPPPPPTAAARLVGSVATGAALAGADVVITDSTGAAACTESTLASGADGNYSCTLKDGAAAPYLVVVTDPAGGHAPMLSVGSTTPAAGAASVVNATPLTTAIVGQLSPDDSALTVIADRSLLDVAQLDAIKAKVLVQLGPVLAALSVPAGFDPFTTPLVAATPDAAGDAADRLIDVLRFSSVNGQTVIATIDQPDAAVLVADAVTSTPATVPAPVSLGSDLQAGLRRLARALNACFAVPVAQRVLAVDDTIPASQGGPEVMDTADACDGIVGDDDFLHNGYRAGQLFHGLLTDAAMDGALFSVPEVMRFLPDDSGGNAPRAIVNLRYRSADGDAGSVINVAQRLTQDFSAVAKAGDWLLFGNRQQVHTSISAALRRRDQLAPEPGVGLFANAGASRYESAFNLFVNTTGPGSEGLRAARFRGPGLPPAGVVLTPVDASICAEQNWMNLRRKDGLTDAASTTPSGAVGNLFRIQRTRGVAGADATTRRSNPSESGVNQYAEWAHPLDYGRPAGSSDYIDFTQLRAMTVYTVELYYDGETAPRHSYDKTMLTPMLPATTGASQPWVAMDAAARRYLDPADVLAAATAQIALSWVPNPFAEVVRSAGVYTTGADRRVVSQGAVSVQRGSSGATALAPTGAACDGAAEFPALDAGGTSRRQFQLRYRTLDGSFKDSHTMFN